ncbi:acetylglutamate kinase [Bacillus massiliigorillae]|uniref:acetylglutamate kinase n=1 Tax=Bacillus massiliigorillae TaxID=1243664 RepID=UPI0003A822B2|nr:acetylglutamate kinase [Bacillus massiliigorillae]
MKILLIKLGGSILNELHESFFTSLKDLQAEGYKLVFVHGGGPDINEMLDALQIVPEFHNGLRRTTKDVLDVVELVLSGKTNRTLVSLLQKYGFSAIGLHGNDANLLQGDYIDQSALGEVGEITNVNSDLIMNILSLDLVPVLTPLALSENGKTLNVNADMAAGAVAKALNAESCVFVTDVKGVLENGALVERMTLDEAEQLIEDKVIYGGMIPKVKTALKTLQTGIEHVRIVSGKEHFFESGKWVGTSFVEKVRV